MIRRDMLHCTYQKRRNNSLGKVVILREHCASVTEPLLVCKLSPRAIQSLNLSTYSNAHNVTSDNAAVDDNDTNNCQTELTANPPKTYPPPPFITIPPHFRHHASGLGDGVTHAKISIMHQSIITSSH
ncbi:hypothetical protein CDAR_498551 [Caerostris darwini]|uniref:Uncharacterized protein n=1 Tax=Caerostris darwini TaxID=1538125 RepID=A0AAV4SKZ2_9ARAC|nr:hypothetical protein CDAR_498551 [Caerostris darwini]